MSTVREALQNQIDAARSKVAAAQSEVNELESKMAALPTEIHNLEFAVFQKVAGLFGFTAIDPAAANEAAAPTPQQ